ncbi:ankyrin repeat-containing domain protein [Cladorrhinum sp. PSN332]|nr:ankyrin repeat-containing domain protein [Cladorrhinum sp. PSN332]
MDQPKCRKPRRFRDLPNEIILMIVECLDNGSYHNWSPLARVDRRCHELLNPILYKRGDNDAMEWAVEFDSLPTLQAVLRYSTQSAAALVNSKAPETILVGPDWVCLRGNLSVWRRRKDWHDWREGISERSVSWDASLLHISCAYGHIDSTQFLLEGGADIHDPVQRFCPCLYLEDQVKLNHDGEGEVFDNLENVPTWLPIHHALCSQNPEVALLLLEKGASLRATAPGTPLVTALQSSAAHGANKVVRYLLQRHHESPTDETLPSASDDNGYTAFHYLSLCFDSDAVLSISQQLIDAGLSVNGRSAPDEDDGDAEDNHAPFGPTTPLALACYFGNFAAAKALLQLGASKFATVNGSTLLELALSAHWTTWSRSRQDHADWQKDRFHVVRQLILAGVSADPFGLVSPLMYAAKSGLHDEMAVLLNFCSVDLERGDEDGQTALHYAVEHSWPQAVELLLEKGSDVNMPDRFGYSPVRGLELRLFEADDNINLHERRLDVLHLLLRYGANLGLMGQNDNRRSNMGVLEDVDLGLADLNYPRFSNSVLSSELEMFFREKRYALDLDDEDLYLDEILKHATRANINFESWDSALYYVITPFNHSTDVDLKRRKKACRKLLKFASRVGYIFDDNTSNKLARVINEEIEESDEARFVDLFFAMGSEDGVPTVTGVFTREAMLVIAMLARSKAVVQKLLTGNECSVKGRIPSLSNSTLLQIAAIAQDPQDIAVLLELYGSALDVNAVTSMGETALSILIGRKDDSLEMLEAIQMLLALGADPYFRCQDPTESMPLSEGRVDNLLEPKSGKPLSRCAATMIGQNTTFRKHANRTGRSFVFPCPSFLEMAIRENRVDIVELIAKFKPKTAEQLANVAGCGRSLLSQMELGHHDMVRQLLRLGVDSSHLAAKDREVLTRPPYRLEE